MTSFVPRQALIQEAALEYPLGRELLGRLQAEGVQVSLYDKKIPPPPQEDFAQRFFRSKRTMVVLVWKRRDFQTCRPSAHYQLPLVSGCPGLCQYCYLNTNLGRTPYVKVYVNVEDILGRAGDYVNERKPATTVFEGSATSDPVAVESWTGSLRRAVRFFAALDNARFRFATKYADVGGLLEIPHNGKTEVRFSINCNYALEKFETGTPRLQSRLEAARKIAGAGYPLGFLVGPIFVFEGWQEEYVELLRAVRDHVPGDIEVTFELITHRFTARSKRVIEEAYPDTELPLDEGERRFRHGQFGYGKYVYRDRVMAEIREFFEREIEAALPRARILYIV